MCFMSEADLSAKKQYDMMTKQPVNRLIIMLAIPTILSMMVTTIYLSLIHI